MARANRLARALLARGLGREAVVAVVTERNLDWLAAVLAIFKAGGVYLPIEPHFPADRIAAMLSRADCGLVLTEHGSTATLDQALTSLPNVQTLCIEAAYEEGHADGNVGVRVTPNQLAYIYFTSGSTGEPKGAMCEHAGMINHLFAKIDDLGIGAGIGGRADRTAVFRHFVLAVGVRAAGRRPHLDHRAGRDLGCGAVRRHHR